MALDPASNLELQKILGFEESTIRMNSTNLSSSEKFDPEGVMDAVKPTLDDVLYIYQTFGLQGTGSTLKQKEDLLPPTGPSLLLSDSNIPKSTYVSSSKQTTGQQSFINSAIHNGPLNADSSQQSAKRSQTLGYQESGNHYRKYPIQPTQYIVANGLGFLAGNVIKYTTRYKDKNGAEDIRKAIHYLNMILEFEYNNEKHTT